MPYFLTGMDATAAIPITCHDTPHSPSCRLISRLSSLISCSAGELQQDEAYKEANCRLCPHCGKAVAKIDGCDSMTCGQDYHGGNKQAGCGKGFNWSTARPYIRPGDAARLPRTFEEVGAVDPTALRHHLADGSVQRCDACRTEIAGPRFSCIHCPGGLDVCVACAATPVPLARLGHTPVHAFQIHFEDAHAA
jgi:hypothetical protein